MIFHVPGYHIARFTLGPYATNCYVISRQSENDEAWIIDASFEPDPMIEYLRSRRLSPAALIYTHAHIDHIAGAHQVLRAFPAARSIIHREEERWLLDAELNLSIFSGKAVTAPPASETVLHGAVLTLGGDWQVLHTPGHSPGGISLYQPEAGVAMVGDALFAGSIGRTDFPGCSFETLERSIKTHLYTLPDATRIFPGHGPESTIGEEKRENPFVKG